MLISNFAAFVFILAFFKSEGYVNRPPMRVCHDTNLVLDMKRRDTIQQIAASSGLVFLSQSSIAAEFTPGGSLVDREIGIQVGNNEASPSRKADNSNVLFDKDYYFKFGVAAPWIPPGSTDFPKSMPFAKSQQRYDNLKKYGDRIKKGVETMVDLKNDINSNRYSEIKDSSAPEYMLRPFGLMANGFIASENTGTTNELFLSRYYVNEMQLRIDDIRNARSKEEANLAYASLLKAIDSYFSMINRVITPKIGDKFQYVTI